MAITLVQTATALTYSNTLAGTITFVTQNVTIGNYILVLSYHFDVGGSSHAMSFADGTNTYTNDVVSNTGSNFVELDLVSAPVVTGGYKPTVTATISGGTSTNMRGALVAYEYSGVGGFDQGAQTHNLNSTTPATGSTGGLANTNDLIFSIVGANASLAGATTPPTGGPGSYTDIAQDLTGGSGSFYDFARQQIAGSNAAVSAAWGTLSSSRYWQALVGTYKPTAAVGNKMLLLTSNQGGF